MDIKPIKSEVDYEAALTEIETLMDADPGTPDGDRLDVMVTLAEVYEEANFPIWPPTPIEALEYYIDTRGLTRQDLEPYIGGSGRVSEILSGKRALTLRMIRKLHTELGIPAEVLINEPA